MILDRTGSLFSNSQDPVNEKNAANTFNKLKQDFNGVQKGHDENINKVQDEKNPENRLKVKFSNCFESVRKAFLTLDQDYDGFITVEDILKYFDVLRTTSNK